MMSEGFVYFVRAAGGGPIKIGFTAVSPEARLAALQTGNAQPLEIVAAVNGSRDLEVSLHRRFQSHRLSGEWFAEAPELLAMLDGILMARRDCVDQAKRDAAARLELDGVEFAQLLEEVAIEIKSRREHDQTMRLVHEDHEGADEGSIDFWDGEGPDPRVQIGPPAPRGPW